MTNQTFAYQTDMWVWTDHPDDVWHPARIVDISQKQLHVSYLSGKTAVIDKRRKLSILSIGSFNEDLQNEEIYKDLSKMASLSTQSVLFFLRKAYYAGIYYTNLGSGTILAINPFQDVDELFNAKKVHAYHSASLSELGLMPAHVFSVAERALRHMLAGMQRENQSIIISGESGAGKTWTVRCLMRYLAVVGIDTTAISCKPEAGDSRCLTNVMLSESFVGDQIEHRILSSNPILEAFGNAATPRNHNSSRFGKYIQLQYDRSGTIVGAKLQVYLLEKTRVANHTSSERPYHIFPQLFYGSTPEERKEWQLPKQVSFQEHRTFNQNWNNNVDGLTSLDEIEDEDLNQDKFHVECDIDKMDDDVAFKKTCKSMLSVGISHKMQSQIFKILSVILHLERLLFDGADDMNNPCSLTADCQSNGKHAASLLAVPINCLLQAVTVREIQAGGSSEKRRSIFKRSCTREECSSRRDALMKYLYEQVFLWLVKHIGNDLCAPPNEACSFIGLLDVYGFESFHENGLEQLCINYANEKLQQYYVSNFLKLQQEELALEGVSWEGLDLNNKVSCLNVLESPRSSIFALLNEECRLNRASNPSQLRDRISEHFFGNGHICRPRISTSTPAFSVLHYAGSVTYDTDQLIMKNKDELPHEIANLLMNSRNEFVQNLISRKVQASLARGKAAKGKAQETVLTEFKKSLDGLLTTLSSTNCHYIRCIKPNNISAPSQFDSFHVVDQLRSSGVVETVQICGHLHPHRISYPHFLSHFSFLLQQKKKMGYVNMNDSLLIEYDAAQETCNWVLNFICWKYPYLERAKSWKFGKNFIFLSSILYEILENERSQQMNFSATKIQVAWLSYSHRKRCRELRKRILEERKNACLVFQRAWRLRLLITRRARERRVKTRKRHNASRVIQQAWLAYVSRKQDRIKQQEELAALQNVTTEDSGSESEFKIPAVNVIDVQYASLHNTTDTLAEKKVSKSETFLWYSWSGNSYIIRYFPSMTLMSLHLLCMCFKRPLDLVSRCYTQTVEIPCCHAFYQNSFGSSFSSNFSLTSEYSEVCTLPLNSFNLSDTDEFYLSKSPSRSCILPYSNVAPKAHDT
ncbi:unnamed protein product [Clavelina lepadiformis]|uniref:Myosin motor domain-containing protein n=2 Tax=Clavelina lepadiformis TaxID=159417 RepID=A0ABP0GQU5_CLALP